MSKMNDLLLQNEEWKEEETRKLADFLDKHAPKRIANNFRIMYLQERELDD